MQTLSTNKQFTIHFSNTIPLHTHYDLLIDGLCGFSFKKPIYPKFADLIHAMNQHKAPTFSIDLPSGLSADQAPTSSDICIKADCCLSLMTLKKSCSFPESKPYLGHLFLANLHFPHYLLSDNHKALNTGSAIVHISLD